MLLSLKQSQALAELAERLYPFLPGKRCRDAGVRPSTGSVGDCYDNAMCESIFATLR